MNPYKSWSEEFDSALSSWVEKDKKSRRKKE